MNTAHYLLATMGRKNVVTLLTIICVASMLDIVGIAIIFPFLQVVTQPDLVSNFFMGKGISIVGYLTHEQIILMLGVTLILFSALKTVVQSLLVRVQAKYLARFTADNTNEIVSHVLNTRYAVFQETAVSEIAGTAYSNTVHATLALTALAQAFNEALILLLLLIVFFIFKPMLALGAVVAIVVTSYIIFQLVIRRASQIGIAQSQIENVRYRLLFSIATAIRDIKIMGLEELFDTRNRHISRDYANLAWQYNFNASLPRLLIEFIALLVIVVAALSVVLFKIPLDTAGPILGMVAVATVRAVPAFSRLFNSISSFRSSAPFVTRLIELQNKLANSAVFRKSEKLTFNQKIELKNISFLYGGKTILNKVNLHLKHGESIGIVGSSGAGKTTLLDLFTGLQPASSGQFVCDGVSFDPFTSRAMQKIIGYVPQSITLLDDTVAFNVSFEEQPDIELVMSALRMANLQGMIYSLPEGIQTKVGENGLRLSGGQRQRIGIARALYRLPEILVFDEATSALDTLSEKELTAEIEKLRGKVSTIIVAHRLSTVIACDRIYVLSDGAIECSGSHSELLQKSKIYKKLYASQSYGDSEESSVND